VDDELCQVAVIQPEEDSCESEREFFQGDPDFPCAEEDWLPHDDDEPEYDYRQVQQAMRQEQTPPNLSTRSPRTLSSCLLLSRSKQSSVLQTATSATLIS
jgi:hypothetical protein